MPLDVISYSLAEGKASWSDVKSNLKSEGAYNLLSKTVATIVVAASNSKNKEKADYVCDGTADEEEINAAINALPSSGGTVLLLEGTYNIASSITILSDNITLAGVGHATKIFLVGGADCHPIQVGDESSTISNCVVRDLQVDGNKDNQSSGGRGIYLNGASGAEILNSAVINCYVHDTFAEGIYVDYCNNCKILHNTCEATSLWGIYLGQSYKCAVIGNICLSCYEGIGVRGGNNIIASNVCDSCTPYYGIRLINAYDCIAIGNSVSNCGSDGINLYRAYRCVVVGNRCADNGGYGINVCDAYSNTNLIGKNHLTLNDAGGLNDAGTNTVIGVYDTTNNNDNVV